MKKVVNFLSSMKVAVYTFIILLIVSAVGAFIPQGLGAEMYQARYPGWLAAVILACQFDTVYESWYFIGLIVFLSASVFTCLIKRLRVIIAPYRLPDEIGPGDVKGWRLIKEYGSAASADDAASALGRAGYNATVVAGGVVGHRRRWSRFGEFFVHAGVLIIIIGGAVRGLGHEENVHLFEGYRFRLPDELSADTTVECVDVEAERDANTGRIIEYRTRVKVSAPGRKDVEQVVEVNGPLHYGHLAFYQVEMNDEGEAALAFTGVKLRDDETADDLLTVEVEWRVAGEKETATVVAGSTVELGGTGYTLHLLDYFANFYVTEEGVTDTNPERNPTVVWMLVKGDGPAARGFSFYDDSDMDIFQRIDPALAGEDFRVKLVGVPEPLYRESYLAASGSYVPLGDNRVYVYLQPDPTDNPDLRARRLALEDTATGRSIDVGFGERLTWELPDGTYVVQFLGKNVASYSGLTVSRDPGLGVFYAGAILFSLGVIMALYLRHERIYVVNDAGKTIIAGQSNKGNDMFAEKFGRVTIDMSKKLGLKLKE